MTFLSCNLLIYKTVAVETRNPLLAYQFWSKQILIDNLEFCWTMQLHILLDQSHNQPYLLLWSSPSIIIIITSTYDIFPVVMYGYKSWTIKKTEHWRIDAFDLWCWKRLLRVPWTARSNESILKEISLDFTGSTSAETETNTLATWCEKLTDWKIPWCWERLKTGGEGHGRGYGWMVSPTQWTWVWACSRSWW